ncbi:MAG: Hsp70 family protein, partial [Epsilonproteobacteria bacterium]|nr:Hsp70 family protein [Campylobacterota bacterium]
EFAKDNKSLGQFNLEGIPPAPRGVPQIEVTFDIDANGILTVSAKDKATGKAQEIKITGSSGLSEEEIERMIKDAELHKAEDEKRKQLVEAKNQADALAHQTEKSLKEVGDKISADEKAKVEKVLGELKELLKKEDVTKEEIDAKVQELTQVSHKLAEAMYKQDQGAGTGAQGGAQQGGSQKGGDDDVIDAEVE